MNTTAKEARGFVEPAAARPMTDEEADEEFKKFEESLPERFLAEAARGGDLETVRRLVEGVPGTLRVIAKGEVVGRVPPHARGAEALRWACLNGHADVATYLLGIPLPPEEHAAAAREFKYEAVRAAVEGGYSSIVAALIPYLTLEDLVAAKAAERAACYGHAEVMRILIVRHCELSRSGPGAAKMAKDSLSRALTCAVDETVADKSSAGALAVLMYFSKPNWRQLWAYLVHDALGTGANDYLVAAIRRWGGDLSEAESALAAADLQAIPLPPGDTPRARAIREFAMHNASAPGMAYLSWKCLRDRLGV